MQCRSTIPQSNLEAQTQSRSEHASNKAPTIPTRRCQAHWNLTPQTLIDFIRQSFQTRSQSLFRRQIESRLVLLTTPPPDSAASLPKMGTMGTRAPLRSLGSENAPHADATWKDETHIPFWLPLFNAIWKNETQQCPCPERLPLDHLDKSTKPLAI